MSSTNRNNTRKPLNILHNTRIHKLSNVILFEPRDCATRKVYLNGNLAFWLQVSL